MHQNPKKNEGSEPELAAVVADRGGQAQGADASIDSPKEATTWILGMACGYRWHQLYPFLQSLAKTGYRGGVCLFHNGVDRQTKDYAERNGIALLSLPRQRPAGQIVSDPAGMLRLVLPMVRRWVGLLRGRFPDVVAAVEQEIFLRYAHFANLRFLLAREFLAARAFGEETQILLTDVRDVVFQADPFSDGGEAFLATFDEEESITALGCPCYHEWFEASFGDELIGAMGGLPVSCCAVTLGPAPLMLDYLERFCRYLYEAPGERAYQFGFDSGIHNRLVLEMDQGSHRRWSNAEGAVVHLGGIPPQGLQDRLRIDPDGGILDGEGRLVPIVHQYDRHPPLAERLFGALGLEVVPAQRELWREGGPTLTGAIDGL